MFPLNETFLNARDWKIEFFPNNAEADDPTPEDLEAPAKKVHVHLDGTNSNSKADAEVTFTVPVRQTVKEHVMFLQHKLAERKDRIEFLLAANKRLSEENAAFIQAAKETVDIQESSEIAAEAANAAAIHVLGLLRDLADGVAKDVLSEECFTLRGRLDLNRKMEEISVETTDTINRLYTALGDDK